MFLLIIPRPSLPVNPQDISIHLMFLLIEKSNTKRRNILFISIHLMFLLIGTFRILHILGRIYFNTSHVSINLEEDGQGCVWVGISIHLMFLLISQCPAILSMCSDISIHLMFLLIAIASICREFGVKFQYISCFY